MIPIPLPVLSLRERQSASRRSSLACPRPLARPIRPRLQFLFFFVIHYPLSIIHSLLLPPPPPLLLPRVPRLLLNQFQPHQLLRPHLLHILHRLPPQLPAHRLQIPTDRRLIHSHPLRNFRLRHPPQVQRRHPPPPHEHLKPMLPSHSAPPVLSNFKSQISDLRSFPSESQSASISTTIPPLR